MIGVIYFERPPLLDYSVSFFLSFLLRSALSTLSRSPAVLSCILSLAVLTSCLFACSVTSFQGSFLLIVTATSHSLYLCGHRVSSVSSFPGSSASPPPSYLYLSHLSISAQSILDFQMYFPAHIFLLSIFAFFALDLANAHSSSSLSYARRSLSMKDRDIPDCEFFFILQVTLSVLDIHALR